MRNEQILAQIRGERVKQVSKWGVQTHPDGTGPTRTNTDRLVKARARDAFERTRSEGVTWLAILDEEVAEAFVEQDLVKLRAELIQVAAVATAWIEDIDRRPVKA